MLDANVDNENWKLIAVYIVYVADNTMTSWYCLYL